MILLSWQIDYVATDIFSMGDGFVASIRGGGDENGVARRMVDFSASSASGIMALDHNVV